MKTGLIAMVAGLCLTATVRADTYVWTQTNRGVFNWSDMASWSNNAAPPGGGGSNVTVQLFTNNAVTAGYAQTNINDVADPLTLNALKVRTTGVNANNTVQGGALNFVADGATQPLVTIDVNGGNFRLRNDFILGNAPLTFSFPQGQNTGNIYLDGAISGTGNLIFANNGFYTYLNGNKTFIGDVVTSNRAVTLGGTNLWTGNVTVRNGAALYLGALAANNNYIGSTTVDPGGVLEVNSASGTWTNDVVNNGMLSYYNGGSPIYTFDNRISGSGNLRSTGNAATLLLAGTNNTYTGKTYIQFALQIYSIGNLGEPSSIGAPTTEANGTIDFTSTATLKYLGAGNASDRSLNILSSSATLDSSGTGPLVLNGALVITNAGNRTLTLQGTFTNAENILAGNIVNTTLPTVTNYTALTKKGDGTWLLTGNNTYTGVTDISAGQLRVTNAASLSPGNIYIRAANSPQVGVLETSFDLIRDGGTSSNQMRIDQVAAGSAFNGFSARGAPITVQFGAASPASLTWGVMPLNVQGSLLLNHLTADSKLTFPNPVSLGNSAAAYRNIGVFANVAEMSGALTQGASGANLRKWGAGELILSANNTLSNVLVTAGTLTLTGTNTFRDATVSAGTALNLSGSNAFGNVTVGAGAALDLSGANAFSNLTSSGTVTLSDTNTFKDATVNAGTLTLNGSNTYNNVTLNGGTLQLGGAKVPAGTMTLSSGTLVLDYTVENNDKLDPTKGLTFAPGNHGAGVALQLIGNASPFTQVVNGLTLTYGLSDSIAIASGQASLSLGAITRNAPQNMNTSPGSTYAGPVLVLSNAGAGTSMATISGSANTIVTSALGTAYATCNGDWAAKGAGNVNIVDGASLGGFYSANAWGAGNNTDVTGSSSPASGSTTHSLRFNTAAANTVTLSGANTITSGGILVTPTVGANLSRITGGSLAAGATGKELVIFQNNTNGDLQIDSTLTGSAFMLTKAGPGKLMLTAANTMNGGYFVSGGTLQFGDGTTIGTIAQTNGSSRVGDVLVGVGATVRTAGGPAGLTNSIYSVYVGGAAGGYATIDVGSNARLISKTGVISASGSSSYWVKIGSGTLELLGQTGSLLPGWVKEGVLVASADKTFTGNAASAGNLPMTIGDAVPEALDASVVLNANISQFDSVNNTDTLNIRRTGTLDLKDKSFGSGWVLDNLNFTGGGAITSSSGSPGSFGRFWSSVNYSGANSNDVGAVISAVSLTLSNNVTFTVNDSAYVDTELTVSSDIASGGLRNFVKAGAGTMALSGNNTYTGTNTVSAGTLIVKKLGSLPGYNVMSGVVVSANATLAVSAGGAGEWTAADIDALRGTTPSPFASGAYLGIDTAGGDFTYGSIIGNGVGALGLRKLGTNTLTLTQASSYTGGTTIEKGTLVASNANALGTSGTITVLSNAMLGVASGVTFSRAVTFNAGSGLTGNGTFVKGGAWTPPANFTVAPGLPAGTLTVDRSLALAAGNTLRIAFQPNGTYGKLVVNGALDISEPTARLVVTGKPPAGRHVLAEGTAVSGQFQESNVDLTGLTGSARITYTATQVLLKVDAKGTLIWIR